MAGDLHEGKSKRVQFVESRGLHSESRQVADVERRTLDLLLRASELESTRPIEAEELRFKASLCGFLCRCEKESLHKVCEVPCKLKVSVSAASEPLTMRLLFCSGGCRCSSRPLWHGLA
jgi:hypothetical protein